MSTVPDCQPPGSCRSMANCTLLSGIFAQCFDRYKPTDRPTPKGHADKHGKIHIRHGSRSANNPLSKSYKFFLFFWISLIACIDPIFSVLNASEYSKFELAYQMDNGQSKSIVGGWDRTVDGTYFWQIGPTISLEGKISLSFYKSHKKWMVFIITVCISYAGTIE
jgi:hypothetical protein